MVEVHPCPERALSDGAQSLDLEGFALMMHGLSVPLPGVARWSDRSMKKEDVAQANSQDEVGELV